MMTVLLFMFIVRIAASTVDTDLGSIHNMLQNWLATRQDDGLIRNIERSDMDNKVQSIKNIDSSATVAELLYQEIADAISENAEHKRRMNKNGKESKDKPSSDVVHHRKENSYSTPEIREDPESVWINSPAVMIQNLRHNGEDASVDKVSNI